VESRTAKVPSLVYLGLALGSMAASTALLLSGRRYLSIFVAQWAPSILVIGLYNKLTKELALPQREGVARFSGAASAAAEA
jgi:hypothetical protein